MPDWTFPAPPAQGHYEHAPVGPYVCVLRGDGLYLSLWRKKADGTHFAYVDACGKPLDHHIGPVDMTDANDPAMQFVPVSTETFDRLELLAAHLYDKKAWAGHALRAAEGALARS